MSVKKMIFEVGFDKNGQADFGVNGQLYSLDLEKMNQLRIMIVAGIGTMEDMWRREQERLNPAQGRTG